MTLGAQFHSDNLLMSLISAGVESCQLLDQLHKEHFWSTNQHLLLERLIENRVQFNTCREKRSLNYDFVHKLLLYRFQNPESALRTACIKFAYEPTLFTFLLKSNFAKAETPLQGRKQQQTPIALIRTHLPHTGHKDLFLHDAVLVALEFGFPLDKLGKADIDYLGQKRMQTVISYQLVRS